MAILRNNALPLQKQLKLSDLNEIYTKADECDREIFAEQRSNILLISSEHYARKSEKISSNLRDRNDLTETQKLRLTKNHIHKIVRYYEDSILAACPGVHVDPQLGNELQDQKDAEMNQAVWTDIKNHHRMKEKIRNFASDFCGIGEVAVKITFDPNKGYLKGYAQKVDEMEQPVFDEMGQPVADENTPVFSGDWNIERLFAFNILREPGAKSMQDSEYLILRKMVKTQFLKDKYASDPDKSKYIQDTGKDEFIVFDSDKAMYERTKNHSLLKEIYIKPCYNYPQGYFYIYLDTGVLEEGELPEGVFPIVWQGFDEYQTTARGRSIIKVARPYQAEINRASSAQALHQITIGDDKIIYQAGTKLSPGSLLPGVRGVTFQGAPPTILPGRDGAQYVDYINSQISEMYSACMVQEIASEDMQANLDPYTLLFRSMSQTRKYAKYASKFEQFMVDMVEVLLKLAKFYYPDDMLIQAVGRKEYINIAEFRKTTPLCYRVKVEAQSDTVESKLGKQLTLNHVLQYVGANMDKDSIGKILKSMPFGNVEGAFDDMTVNFENSQNDMLMLERGEQPVLNKYDDHVYLVKRATSRMRQSDFKFLPPQIQQMYDLYVQQHEQIEAQNQQEIIAAKNEYIPVGGALISCDFYVANPKDPSGAAKRVRIPYQALDWLVKQLETQGASLDKLEQMNQGSLAEMAQMINQSAPASMAQNQPVESQRYGVTNANPIGVN